MKSYRFGRWRLRLRDDRCVRRAHADLPRHADNALRGNITGRWNARSKHGSGKFADGSASSTRNTLLRFPSRQFCSFPGKGEKLSSKHALFMQITSRELAWPRCFDFYVRISRAIFPPLYYSAISLPLARQLFQLSRTIGHDQRPAFRSNERITRRKTARGVSEKKRKRNEKREEKVGCKFSRELLPRTVLKYSKKTESNQESSTGWLRLISKGGR